MKRILLLFSLLGFLLVMDYNFPYQSDVDTLSCECPSQDFAQNVSPSQSEDVARFESGQAYDYSHEFNSMEKDLEPFEKNTQVEPYTTASTPKPKLNAQESYRRDQVERAAFVRMEEAIFESHRPPSPCGDKRWLSQ